MPRRAGGERAPARPRAPGRTWTRSRWRSTTFSRLGSASPGWWRICGPSRGRPSPDARSGGRDPRPSSGRPGPRRSSSGTGPSLSPGSTRSPRWRETRPGWHRSSSTSSSTPPTPSPPVMRSTTRSASRPAPTRQAAPSSRFRTPGAASRTRSATTSSSRSSPPSRSAAAPGSACPSAAGSSPRSAVSCTSRPAWARAPPSGSSCRRRGPGGVGRTAPPEPGAAGRRAGAHPGCRRRGAGAPLIKRVLRDHDVVCMLSAGEALALIDGGERFDLILSDVVMEEMSGIDFYEALLRRIPTWRAISSSSAAAPSARGSRASSGRAERPARQADRGGPPPRDRAAPARRSAERRARGPRSGPDTFATLGAPACPGTAFALPLPPIEESRSRHAGCCTGSEAFTRRRHLHEDDTPTDAPVDEESETGKLAAVRDVEPADRAEKDRDGRGAQGRGARRRADRGWIARRWIARTGADLGADIESETPVPQGDWRPPATRTRRLHRGLRRRQAGDAAGGDASSGRADLGAGRRALAGDPGRVRGRSAQVGGRRAPAGGRGHAAHDRWLRQGARQPRAAVVPRRGRLHRGSARLPAELPGLLHPPAPADDAERRTADSRGSLVALAAGRLRTAGE